MDADALEKVASESSFSLFGLLMEADPIVKAVLVILLIASIWSWSVVIEKYFSVSKAVKKAKAFEDAFWSGRSEEFDLRPGQTPDNASGPRSLGYE